MTRFDVLSRETTIDSHIVLEASAGTGKTFSIENLVVRLLVDEKIQLSIQQILIVTFTKMATSDLKVRVRDNIENAASALESGVLGKFDYLVPIYEDERRKKKAIRLLERALISFDEAQIFTIHGFCYRMLVEHGMEGYVGQEVNNEGKGVSEEKYKSCVLDYFRTGLNDDSVGRQHRSQALNSQRGDIGLLEKKLAEIIAQGVEIEKVPSKEELYARFKDSVIRLKKVHGLQHKEVKEDLDLLSTVMKKVSGNDQALTQIFCEFLEKNEPEENDFEKFVEFGPDIFKFFNRDNRNKRKKFPQDDAFHYPNLIEILHEELKLFQYKSLGIARMAYDCRKLMLRQFDEEELKSFDDLLEVMRHKLKEEKFLKEVRNRYQAVIVDEFQDTDPRQWEIFKKAFPPDDSGWGRLYLVGDPKQSIYAFRQADIYTYIEAAEAIGRDHVYSLETNFRSQPSLVKALNYLFSAPFKAGWMPLPKHNSYMNVPEVRWDETKSDLDFKDDRKAVHWCIYEAEKSRRGNSDEEVFYPFIAQEIQRLRDSQKMSLRSFAILISDRHQAKRVSDYLKHWNIPSQRQKIEPLSESSVIPYLRELLIGITRYKDESALKLALGGKFIRWDAELILTLENDEVFADIQEKFRDLDEVWKNSGLSACMEKLLLMKWTLNSKTVLELILEEENGDQFYTDLHHVMELILEEPRTPSESISFLEKFVSDTSRSEDDLKRRLDISQDCVQIITIHSSKGLEYDIVFALGLISRPKKNDLYYLSEGILRFVQDKEYADYQNYLNEMDAEKMRSLYVACTRPKYRLYLPYIQRKTANENGLLSPIELFVNQFSIPLMDFLNGSTLHALLSYTQLNEAEFILKKSAPCELPILFKPEEVAFRAVSKTITSFSSLANVGVSDTSEAPYLFDAENRSSHTLPSGSTTGTLLHLLLEEIPFEEAVKWNSPKDAEASVAPYIKGGDFEEWGGVISEMVFYALTTPFVNGFALRNLSPHSCKLETEFLYAYGSETFMKGFIDLLFFCEGKFYLLDWKSNWLGEGAENYTEEAIHASMIQHDYYKQAEIYAEALRKYLNLTQDQPFQTIFGGVYYIYLRGLPTHGVKFIPPSFFNS